MSHVTVDLFVAVVVTPNGPFVVDTNHVHQCILLPARGIRTIHIVKFIYETILISIEKSRILTDNIYAGWA